jgi:hypothetical protein
MRIVFMGVGIAEVHEEPIPEQLSNVPVIASNQLRTGGLVGTDHVPVVFGIELAGEFGGIDQVAEHDRELPSFRVGRRRCSRTGFNQRGVLFLGGRRLCYLSRRRGCGRGFCSVPSPHEHSAIFIRGELLCLDDLRFEGFEILVV